MRVELRWISVDPEDLPGSGIQVRIAIGAMVAFVVALLVVRAFVGFVGKRGFAPFAWYRILAGGAALIWLLNK